MPPTRSQHFLVQARQLFQLGSVLALTSACSSVTTRPAAQQSMAATVPLVFDGVTVIDVQQGRRLPEQRVVIVGNRIKTMGSVGTVQLPAGAQVVDARGKYLIPGLWDWHTHSLRATDIYYPLFIANGVTGIRDAASPVPLDTLILWRREILAGTRVGPPRQILSYKALWDYANCKTNIGEHHFTHVACFADAADARHLIDSVKAAGADMIKTYVMTRADYFMVAAEARRVGIPFGGHLNGSYDSLNVFAATSIEASDSGAGIIDHTRTNDIGETCIGERASVDRCRQIAEHFRRNNTWLVPTVLGAHVRGSGAMVGTSGEKENKDLQFVGKRSSKVVQALLAGATPRQDWLRDSVDYTVWGDAPSHYLHIMHQVGMPILAGTDVNVHDRMIAPGFSLLGELAMYVAGGLTPLEALQSATLNPAKFLHRTDSLCTVAPGKLADLVLLDADPLADIANITLIRAVVANGRYFDRAALDQLIAGVQAKYGQEVKNIMDGTDGTDRPRLPPGVH